MAHIQTINGIRYSRGAISKKRDQLNSTFTSVAEYLLPSGRRMKSRLLRARVN